MTNLPSAEALCRIGGPSDWVPGKAQVFRHGQSTEDVIKFHTSDIYTRSVKRFKFIFGRRDWVFCNFKELSPW